MLVVLFLILFEGLSPLEVLALFVVLSPFGVLSLFVILSLNDMFEVSSLFHILSLQFSLYLILSSLSLYLLFHLCSWFQLHQKKIVTSVLYITEGARSSNLNLLICFLNASLIINAL